MENEFKEKCLKAFQYSFYLDKIIENLNTNHLNNLRHYFDLATDELQKEINQPIGKGEESIHNVRVQQLKDMFLCFNELYKIIEIEDGKTIGLLQSSSNQ